MPETRHSSARRTTVGPHPFDKSADPANRNKGYPNAEHTKTGIIVRNRIGVLEPAVATPVLRYQIRMVVGLGTHKRKIAVLYSLRRADEVISEGRLRIKFGNVVD